MEEKEELHLVMEVGGEVEEALVATTWELSQPQGSSPKAISGANAS